MGCVMGVCDGVVVGLWWCCDGVVMGLLRVVGVVMGLLGVARGC